MILKTMDGVVIPIGEDEARQIAASIAARKSHCLVRGAVMPTSGIALYPDEYWEAREQHGRLHDGTHVIRKFGAWVDARSPDVRLSWEHYPELSRDEVLTNAEYTRAGLEDMTIETEQRLKLYDDTVKMRVSAEIAHTERKEIE